MRRLIESVGAQIEEFIEQRDDLLMVVACSAEESAIALKLLREIEQSAATDVFLLFVDDFIQPSAFVSVAVERLRLEHRLASQALIEEGREPLPPIPDALLDASRPPSERLQNAIGFARSLLPRDGGHRLIWAMFPQQVADRQQYLELLSSLVPWHGLRPWMRGARLIFRDEPDSAQFAPVLARAPRVRLNRVDLGPEALSTGLREDVEDETLSDEERMRSLFMLASLDSAHSRNEGAIAKYKVLLGYYQSTGNQTMQAFVISGMGDISRRTGDLERAQYWYECAIEPAAASKQPVVLAGVVSNLGEVAYARKQYAEAEQYFDGWDKLASEALDPESKARALEKRGLSQEQQGAWDRAMASWEVAATLARSIGLPSRLRDNLNHLGRAFRQFGMYDRLNAVQVELRTMEGQEDVR